MEKIHIAFEGIDGSGKTTQLGLQYDALKSKYGEDKVGICYLNSLDHFFGRIVKKLYEAKTKNQFTDFLHKRAVRETIYALCARTNARQTRSLDKDILLSDRSILTAFAHHLGKLPEWYLTFIEPSFYPDVAIYIDVSPELGLERVRNRGTCKSGETLDKLRAFYEGYQLTIGDNRPRVLRNTKIIKIDGTQSLEKVTENVHEAVSRELYLRMR